MAKVNCLIMFLLLSCRDCSETKKEILYSSIQFMDPKMYAIIEDKEDLKRQPYYDYSGDTTYIIIDNIDSTAFYVNRNRNFSEKEVDKQMQIADKINSMKDFVCPCKYFIPLDTVVNNIHYYGAIYDVGENNTVLGPKNQAILFCSLNKDYWMSIQVYPKTRDLNDVVKSINHFVNNIEYI